MGTIAQDNLQPPENIFRVAFLYVGQGESTLLAIPKNGGGHLYALVDCNRAEALGGIDLPRMLRDLLPTSIDGRPRLDLFINTHPHSDHLGGIAQLREEICIDEVWHSGHNPGRDCAAVYDELQALIREVQKRHGNVEKLLGSRTARMLGKATVHVVSPAEYVVADIESESPEQRKRRIHEQCAVLRVRYGSEFKKAGVLITGDSDHTAWRTHITDYHGQAEDNRINAEVLSASHHGSITFFKKDREDESEPYLEHLKKIQPQYVIISAPDDGDSPHEHPHAEAVEHYNAEVRKRFGDICHMGSAGRSYLFDVDSKGNYSVRSDRGALKDEYGLGKKGSDGCKKSPAIISHVENSRPMGDE